MHSNCSQLHSIAWPHMALQPPPIPLCHCTHVHTQPQWVTSSRRTFCLPSNWAPPRAATASPRATSTAPVHHAVATCDAAVVFAAVAAAFRCAQYRVFSWMEGIVLSSRRNARVLRGPITGPPLLPALLVRGRAPHQNTAGEHQNRAAAFCYPAS